ncbi:MAG TPA: hypothetical protein VIC33_07910 [Vicinamibacterales bacterium]|jgi:hypothetical protein
MSDPLSEIRQLYYDAKPATIRRDLARAIELLKLLPTEKERERAAVYMDGLAEMRGDWESKGRAKKSARSSEAQRGARKLR